MRLTHDANDLGSILAFKVVFLFLPCIEKKVSGAIPAITAMSDFVAVCCKRPIKLSTIKVVKKIY